MIKQIDDPTWPLPNTENDYRSIVGGNIQDQPFVAHGVDFKGYFDMFDGGNVGIDAIGSFKRIGNPDQSFNYCTGGNRCHAHHGDDLFKRVNEWPPEDNPGHGDDPANTKGYGAVIFSDVIGAHTYQAFFGSPQVIYADVYDFDEGQVPPWTQPPRPPGSDRPEPPEWQDSWNDWEPTHPVQVEPWKWAEATDDGPGKATRRFDRVGPRGIKFDWFVRGHSGTKGPTLKSLALAYWTPPIGMLNHLSDDLVDAIPDLIKDLLGGSRSTQTAISKKQSIEFFTAYLVGQLENPAKVESKLMGELVNFFDHVPWSSEKIVSAKIPNKLWQNYVDYVDDTHPDKQYWQNLPENDRARSFIHVYAAVRAQNTNLEQALSRAIGHNSNTRLGIGTIFLGLLTAIAGFVLSIIFALPTIKDKLKGQVKRMGIYHCAPLIEWGNPCGEFFESNPNIRFDDTGGPQNMYNRGSSYYCMNDEDWEAVQKKNMKMFIGIIVQQTQVNAADIGIKRNKYFHMMNLGFIYDESTYGDEILLPPRQRIDQPTEEIPSKYCGMLGSGFWGLRRPYAIGNADDPWVEEWPFGFENNFRSKNEGLGTIGDAHNFFDRLDSFIAKYFDEFDDLDDVRDWLESLAPIIEDIEEKVQKVLAFIQYIEDNKGHIKDDIKDAVNDWWNSLTNREQAAIIKQITELLGGLITDQQMIADFTVMKDSGFADNADSNYSNSIFLSDYGVNAYKDSVYQEFFSRSFDTVLLTDSMTSGDLSSGDSAIDSDFQSALTSYFGRYADNAFGFDSLDSNLHPAWWSPDHVHHSQDSDANIWSVERPYDMIYRALNAAGYDSFGDRIGPDYLYDSYGRIPWIRNLR